MSDLRNDISKYAQQIETLAKEIQVRAQNGDSLLVVGNELVRNNISFIFALGELYAEERLAVSPTTQVKLKSVKVVKAGNPNYHNVRDSSGRFAPRV